MTYRERLWFTLLPNVILLLLALLIESLSLYLKKKKKIRTLVCICGFVWGVYAFYINNTLWNRNT